MATSWIGSGTVAEAPEDQNSHSAAALRLSSPIRIFLFFHKPIRAELDELHRTALSLATNARAGDMEQLVDRCHFLRSIYKHHCNAEDEVIFPALDIRVKNVAGTCALEHKGERVLFDQLFTLLDNDTTNVEFRKGELAYCTGVLQTSISQHISKEEEQILTLINEKFSYEEQASLVWKFLCSIPVNMMAEFFQWLSSSISAYEQQDICKCLEEIIPEGKLLQQIMLNWMDGIKMSNKRKHSEDDLGYFSSTINATQTENCPFESPGAVNRDVLLSSCRAMYHPVDDILHWHRAIEKELNDIAQAARSIKSIGDSSDLSALNRRLQFIAEVSVFYSIAEDKIIFPAVNAEMSLVQEHARDKSELDMFRRLIESIESSGTNSTLKFNSELCSQTDHLREAMKKHFVKAETQVLPFARKHFRPERQQELVYQSLCVMPLRLIECVLPWLFGSLSEEKARHFLYNMHMAAPVSDTALVTLFSGWACKGFSGSVCLSSSTVGYFSAKELKETPEHIGRSCCFCVHASASNENAPACKCKKTVMQGNVVPSLEISLHNASAGIGSTKASIANQSCCAPGLGVNNNGTGMNSLAKTKSFQFLLFDSSSSSLNSSLFNWETSNSSSVSGLSTRPIDYIFKFHKAIRKDLEILAVESGKLGDCDEIFMRNFGGRFRLLWTLYRAHSKAEDDIVFPLLESKETLHNVSHSYTLDHKQEEKLFEDISSVLAELSQLKEKLNAKNLTETLGKSLSGSLSQPHCLKKYNELATRIQSMCKAIKVALDDHVVREEVVLWPLFDAHFSIEEQEKLVGHIIGRTGAEMLQSMLPWVTSALTQEEQTTMMDTLKCATKNTMFSKWLNEWWEETLVSSSQVSTSGKSISQGSEIHDTIDQSAHMFKPGWKDIFQMNQNDLELEIRKVSCDSTHYSSKWITSQQKCSQSRTSNPDDGVDLLGRCQSFRDSEKQIFGCKHYKRNCKLLAACCGKLYPCRFCHDEVSDHPMDREVYHCPFCNLCRVGKGLGIDIFHCMNCNCYLAIEMPEHKCWEKSLETNCLICCEFMFTSSALVKDLPYGHYMHIACYQAYGYTHYICPICSKSMGDMSVRITSFQ